MEYDTSRLLVLKRIADQKRALFEGSRDQVDDLRERLSVAKREAARVGEPVQPLRFGNPFSDTHGQMDSVSHQSLADELRERVDRLQAKFDVAQDRMRAAADERVVAMKTYTTALTCAKGLDLKLPAELQEPPGVPATSFSGHIDNVEAVE